MATRTLLNVLLCVTAFVVGVAVAHRGSSGAASISSGMPVPAEISETTDTNIAAENATAPHTPAEVAQRFEAILAEGNYYRQSMALARAMRDLQPGDIEAALAVVDRGKAWQLRWFESEIIARWADFDPAAAAEYALRRPAITDWRGDSKIAISFTKWAERDSAAACRMAEGIEDSAQQATAVQGVMETLMQRDPQAALDWANALPLSVRGGGFFHTVYEAWARKNPEAAAQATLAIADPANRKSALYGVASQWVQFAPKTAADWAMALPDPAQRDGALDAIFGLWAGHDPQAAASVAMPLVPRDATPPQYYHSIVDEMLERDARQALDFALASADGEEGLHRWTSAILRAAWQEPVTALAEAKKLPSVETQGQVLGEILRNIWMADSPHEAVEFVLDGLPQNQVRDSLLPSALQMLASEGEAGMDALAARTDLTTDNLLRAFSAFAAARPEAAMRWAQARPDGPEKQKFMWGLLNGFAQQSPEAAAGLLVQCPPEARSTVIGEIAKAWSESDPARATAWAGGLSDAGERALAWEKLTENWSAMHPVEAATWLKTLPSGPDRDTAAAAYARTVMGIDPGAAIAWAGSIGEPKQREDALRKAYLHWWQFDPGAANAWLEASTDFTAEAKTGLQK